MKRKVALSVLVLAVILASFSLGAYAAVKYSLIINGKTVKADIKVISGTPYIPVTALSKNLKGVTVKYDSKKGTIKIDEPKPAATPDPAKPPAVGLARSNPAPIGTTVTFNRKDLLTEAKMTFKVEQVIRGSEAWDMIKNANMFNKEPEAGYEFMLVKLSVSVVSNANPDAQVSVSGSSFTLVSSSGKDYPYASVVEPDPSISASLYAGASNTGWGAYLVKSDDVNPLLAYGRSYDGTGGAWLKVN